MKDCKKDCKSLVKRCELQIRTGALNNLSANAKEQGYLLGRIMRLILMEVAMNLLA